jgi:hypothetical protein
VLGIASRELILEAIDFKLPMSQLIFEVLIHAFLASQLLFDAFLVSPFWRPLHNQQIQPAEFAAFCWLDAANSAGWIC